jgi:hypothetical protein
MLMADPIRWFLVRTLVVEVARVPDCVWRLCVCCVFLLPSSVGLLFNGFRSSPMLALKKHLFVGGVLKYSTSLVSQILIVYSNNVCYQQLDHVY